MQSVKDSIKSEFNRFGIDSTKKEKCPVCNYGSRITVIVNGQEKSHCKYCEDRKLVEKMNIPETEEEYKRLKTNDKTSYFMRLPNDIRNAKLNDYDAKTDEQKDAKRTAIDFITNFDKKRSLVMSGDPGIGKTHIAVAITNALAKDNSVLFLKSTNLLDLI